VVILFAISGVLLAICGFGLTAVGIGMLVEGTGAGVVGVVFGLLVCYGAYLLLGLLSGCGSALRDVPELVADAPHVYDFGSAVRRSVGSVPNPCPNVAAS
jgi:hypothetical protein